MADCAFHIPTCRYDNCLFGQDCGSEFFYRGKNILDATKCSKVACHHRCWSVPGARILHDLTSHRRLPIQDYMWTQAEAARWRHSSCCFSNTAQLRAWIAWHEGAMCWMATLISLFGQFWSTACNQHPNLTRGSIGLTKRFSGAQEDESQFYHYGHAEIYEDVAMPIRIGELPAVPKQS